MQIFIKEMIQEAAFMILFNKKYQSFYGPSYMMFQLAAAS